METNNRVKKDATKHVFLQKFLYIAEVEVPRQYKDEPPSFERVSFEYAEKSIVNNERQRFAIVIRSNRYGELTESVSLFLSYSDALYYVRERMFEICNSNAGARIYPRDDFWKQIISVWPIIKYHVQKPRLADAAVRSQY